MKKKIVVLVALFALMFGGCIVGTDESGQKTYSIDPNIAEKVEQGVAAGGAVLAILASLGWSAGGVIVGYLGKAIQVWRVIKPKLIEAQTKAEMFHTAGFVTVTGIEEFKKAYPEEWENLSAEIDKVKAKLINPEDQIRIENFILGLRGLPPKA